MGGAALALALALAAHHPLWPTALMATVIVAALLVAWRPALWLVAVPALLPLANLAPWTGWVCVDEFDLAVLAVVGGGWTRLAFDRVAPPTPSRTTRRVIALLTASCLVGLWRGIADTGFAMPGWFDTEADPANTLRVAKSVLFALLLWPLVRRALARSADVSVRWLRAGLWIGMGVVVVAVFRERAAYPGLLDFSSPYRTTALFWEMHVGGAAIDVMVALGAPLAAWAVWSARSPARWAAAALFALAWGYVALTTFSRGVYLAALLALTLLAWRLWTAQRRRAVRWRRAGDWALGIALAIEALGVAASGSFMGERFDAADHDLVGRLDHWRAGIGLLRAPADMLFGIGSGRLPAHYAAAVPGQEFAGRAVAVARPTAVLLSGPKSAERLGGLFGLTQRVPLLPGVRHRVELSYRAATPTELRILVCEMHLLYRRRCERIVPALAPTAADGTWRRLGLTLGGAPLGAGPAWARREAVFALSVANPGGSVELTDLRLLGTDSSNLLRNGRFGDGLAQWFPVAQHDFLPWHIDNLALETLIERGLFGVVASALFFGLALHSAFARPAAGEVAGAFIGSALAAALLVGGVSSVMDGPRTAFLCSLLAVFAIELRGAQSSTEAGRTSSSDVRIPRSSAVAAG